MRSPLHSLLLLAICPLALAAGCRKEDAAAAPPPAPVTFTDITRQAGITFKHQHGGSGAKRFIEVSGSGACFFDYDNDGDPDLYLVQSGPHPDAPGFGGAGNRSALYRNEGGARFTDVTESAGVANGGYGQGACAGDYDGDGFLDLFVTNYGANRLYRNRGDGTFTDVSRRAGVTSSGYHAGAAFLDIDGDGWLDLYVTRYVKYRLGADPLCTGAGVRAYCPPTRFEGETDVLFRNRGNGTFEDVTKSSGVADPAGKSFGVVCVDHNADGRPDLYVANDGTLNRLYTNQGGGRFQDTTIPAGVGTGEGGQMAGGMGTDAGDYDGDGRLDLFVANFTGEPNDLYRNLGDGIFEIQSTPSGLGGASLPFSAFGALFTDYDLDGLPDLMLANGHVDDTIEKSTPGITYAEPSSLYRNVGGRFENVSASAGPDFLRPKVGRGLAAADIDGDGDEDVLMMENDRAPVLLRNDGGNARRWIRLRLRAAQGDPFALGARVTVESGGRRQVREVRSGGSYLSQSDLTLCIGLDRAERADRVTVRWPGRAEQVWQNLPAGRLHLLREGRADPE